MRVHLDVPTIVHVTFNVLPVFCNFFLEFQYFIFLIKNLTNRSFQVFCFQKVYEPKLFVFFYIKARKLR